MIHQVSLVPTTVVFHDIEDDLDQLQSLLGTLGRTDAMIWCSRLNAIISHPLRPRRHLGEQWDLVSFFFTKEEAAKINHTN
jgi:hypothetical protein